MPRIAGRGATTSGDGRVQPAQIRPDVRRGHEPTPRPPGSALGVYGSLQPCRASVARRDHPRVCCRSGIASGTASFGILSRECQKRTGFLLLCQPSPNCDLRPFGAFGSYAPFIGTTGSFFSEGKGNRLSPSHPFRGGEKPRPSPLSIGTPPQGRPAHRVPQGDGAAPGLAAAQGRGWSAGH